MYYYCPSPKPLNLAPRVNLQKRGSFLGVSAETCLIDSSDDGDVLSVIVCLSVCSCLCTCIPLFLCYQRVLQSCHAASCWPLPINSMSVFKYVVGLYDLNISAKTVWLQWNSCASSSVRFASINARVQLEITSRFVAWKMRRVSFWKNVLIIHCT